MIPVIVIGAGLAGLNLARALNAPIIEKSRGVGGRLATRRIDEEKFDHGLPLWPETPIAQKIHKGLSVPNGMTALAKKLATGLTIHLDTRVLRLEKIPTGWRLHTNKEPFECAKVILTAPIPQALELLEDSGLRIDSGWTIPYHKAIVGLYRLELTAKDQSIEWDGHQLVLQRDKGLCADGATLIVSPALSDKWFEDSDEKILKQTTQLLLQRLGPRHLDHDEIKKWRYSRPASFHTRPYIKAGQHLYICGDGFLYPGVEGSLMSVESLLRDQFPVL